jgi:NAD(P)-dependent dehydrogenase (short-subunit alcohol dehydrogenase family)
MEKDLEGKTVLVTGGGRGIGARIAERLARAGAIVAVNYAGNAEAARATVAGIEAEGGQAFTAQARIGEPGEIEKLVKQLDEEFTRRTGDNGLDILINNIGGGGYMTIRTTTVEQFDGLFRLNVSGPFFLTQALIDRLRDQGGRVINISSAAARLAGTDFIAYSILKAGVDMFTRVIAKDLGPRGITVNSVAPGFVRGDTYDDLVPNKQIEDQIRENTLLKRIGEPEEVADFVHALAGEAGRWVTGQNIEASGGFLF